MKLRSIILTWLLAALLPTIAVAATSGQGYRLAGTVSAGKNHLAFLELPAGGQVLVRKGDVIGNVRVLDVRDRAIALMLPGGRLDLELEGSGNSTAAVRTDEVVTASSNKGHVLRREIAVGPLEDAIEQTTPAPVEKARQPTRASPSSVVTRQFAPVFDLPQGASIVAINGESITSSKAAVDQVAKVLADGMPVVMNLKTANGGMARLYLMPQPPPPEAPPKP